MNASLRSLVYAVVWLAVVFVSGCGDPQSPKRSASPLEAPGTTSVDSFLERHWDRPLAREGAAPAGIEPQQLSLAPGACGTCHAAQYDDWRQRLHSRAMGPGVLGQLAATTPGDRESLQACVRCHAPLGEQLESLVTAVSTGKVAQPELPSDNASAHEHGLTCAGCHVRGYRWFGPPRWYGARRRADRLSA